ncbi:hypothetical protein WJR50_29220 [Catalinimonas sp. 4WD22]|uniref:hypothetical protein n=1 Tax=Catalinimonas locisalis TaxID=3133978 RepID=UPI003100CEC3
MGKKGLELFLTEAKEIGCQTPKLRVIEKNDIPIISGELDLVSENEGVKDTYAIEILPTAHYPSRFPLVFETGGRIPRNIDWHIFESTGHCCIKTLPEEILICKNGITLSHFIETEVIPYFFNQTFRRLKGYFLNERSHGISGEIEFFKSELITDNILDIVKWLQFILQRKEPSRSEKRCFCGSQLMYRHCHREAYRKLAKLGNAELQYFIKKITESEEFITAYLKRENNNTIIRL